MSVTRLKLGAQNAWTQVSKATYGSDITIMVEGASTDVFEIATSATSPGGAGTVVTGGKANRVVFPNGAAATSAWVRNTAAAGGGIVTIDDQIEGLVFHAA